jgi:hypothetical protein
MQVDSVETFNEVTSPLTTFKQQAEWWLREMREGRIVSRKKRVPIKPATALPPPPTTRLHRKIKNNALELNTHNGCYKTHNG